MTRPTLLQIALGLAAALLIWWGIASLLDAHHQHQGTQQEQVSQAQHQEAQTHAQAAQAQDAQIPALQATIQSQQVTVAQLKRELATLKSHLAAHDAQPGVVAPVVPGDHPGGPAPDLVAVVAKQDQIIQAQGAQIDQQAALIKSLTASRDEWQAAFQHEQAARLAQEAATRAWKQSVKESRWRGRIEGFAAGVALGYAGGKL